MAERPAEPSVVANAAAAKKLRREGRSIVALSWRLVDS